MRGVSFVDTALIIRDMNVSEDRRKHIALSVGGSLKAQYERFDIKLFLKNCEVKIDG